MGEREVPASEAASKPTQEATSSEPAAPASATKDTSVKPNKRMSMLGGFFGKKDSTASPTGTEKAPTVPAKGEPSAVSPTAPQLDNPVTSPTPEITAPAAGGAATEPVASTDGANAASATTPTDKRRTSFFSNLGTKKEKKAGATSGDELTDSETKKQGGGFGGLLRKASRAQPKKDSKAPVTDPAEVPLPKETGTGDKSAKEAEAPLTNGESTTKETQPLEQKPDLAEGEVGSNAIAKAEDKPTVESTA